MKQHASLPPSGVGSCHFGDESYSRNYELLDTWRWVVKWSFALLALLLVAVASAADLPKLPAPPAGPYPDRPPSYRSMLKIQAVVDEIKLTKEQDEDLRLWSDDWSKKTGAGAVELLKTVTAKDKLTKLTEYYDKADKEYRYGVERRLSPEQIQRFGQIRVQAEGISALEWPEVMGPLTLTEAKKKEVAKIVDKYKADKTEAGKAVVLAGQFTAEVGRKFYDKVKAMEDVAMKDIAKALTPEQFKRWKTVFGEPFDLTVLGPPNLAK